MQINLALREVNCKIVYYGPGRSGKTTNLEMIHAKAPKDSVGDLVSLSTEQDRTLFFDFLPLNLGSVAGMTTKFQLYTVPGQVYYNNTRKLVLQGADGVVFVADSSKKMMKENLESLENLIANLAENGLDISTVPLVLQWNKRDLPDAQGTQELNAVLNRWNVPTCEAVAFKGEGVFPTLKLIAGLVIKKLNAEYGQGGAAPAAKPAPAKPAAPAPAPAAHAPAAPAAAKPPAPPMTPAAAAAAAAPAKTASGSRPAVTPPAPAPAAAPKPVVPAAPAAHAAPAPAAPKPAPVAPAPVVPKPAAAVPPPAPVAPKPAPVVAPPAPAAHQTPAAAAAAAAAKSASGPRPAVSAPAPAAAAKPAAPAPAPATPAKAASERRSAPVDPAADDNPIRREIERRKREAAAQDNKPKQVQAIKSIQKDGRTGMVLVIVGVVVLVVLVLLATLHFTGLVKLF